MINLFVWSGPRNISTALMRSFENRKDTKVYDEPFYAYYLKKTNLNHPMKDEIINHYQTDEDEIIKNAQNFEETIGNKDKPVLVKFGAEWCGPCKMVTPVLNELADEISDQIVIGDHDIDNSPNAPTKFGVRGVPTMLLFKGGEVIDSKVGAASKEDIKSWINSKVG